MEMSFKQWIAEQGPIAPVNPAMNAIATNPKLKNASAIAVKAAADAVKKGQNPMKIIKDKILAMAQTGNIDVKDLGKIMPDEN